MAQLSDASSTHAKRSDSFCPQLTSLRFFAAVVVVLYHYRPEVTPNAPKFLQNLFEHGFVGVTIFFVLSGYILSLNYLKRFQEKKTSLADFWVARLARIYPLYLASLIFVSPYVLLDPAKFPNGEEILRLRSHPVDASAMYLLGAESHWNMDVGRLPLPSWSISTEFFFYALFPIFAALVVKISRRACMVALGVVTLYTAITTYGFYCGAETLPFFGIEAGKWQQISGNFYKSWFAGIHSNWPLFASGMLAFRIFDIQWTDSAKKVLGWICGLVLAISTAVFMFSDSHAVEAFIFPWKNLYPIPMCILLVAWLHRGKGALYEWLGNKWLVLLGEISFALYLVHSPLRLMGRFFFARKLGIAETSPLFYVTMWIITMFAAWLAWKYIEVPARGFILSRWKSRKASPVTTTG